MRVADYIINQIYDECAEHIFTVTGRGILFLTDAAAKHDKIKCISVHHEQAAAFAAAAYGACTGKPGVCLVSTGCAATNAVTGVLCAYQDGVPCVFISGQNELRNTTHYTKLPIRTFGSQEADIISIVKSITKYAVMITDPKKIAYELEKAIAISQQGVKGPVWIDIPLDIQNERIEPDELEHYLPERIEKPFPSNEDLECIIRLINNAERPVVLIGSGIRSAEAIDELKAFVEKCKIPLTYSNSATDVYGLENEISIGSVGALCGTRAGNFAVQNADLLLVLGCRMSSMTTGSECDKFARAAKVIIVDIDKDEHLKNTVNIERIFLADVKETLKKLINLDIKETDLEWVEKCKHWKEIFPKCEEKYRSSDKVDLYYLSDALSKTLPEKSVFICDAGMEELILPSSIVFKDGMRCIHPVMQGSMGYALPAAVGASFACDAPITAVIGDGSIMMNLQELETVRYHKLPVKIFVINNNVYAVIRKRQVDLFRTRTIGTDPQNGLSVPSFKKLAECFGFKYCHIKNSEKLEEKLRAVFEIQSSVICEIDGVENQEYFCDAYALNSKKRVVHRPIEDMFPFIDRELFLSEMVVEPIDQ